MSDHNSICFDEEATYDHRVYNKEQHNFCSVHEKGFDAVLVVAIGVTFTCLAPRKHYAIVMLILGSLLQVLNIEVNIRELSNALNLWIGITPAKTFFYIFLPPLLLDSAVRIDFFVFKKVMSQVFVLAFGVVACNTVLLAVFMLYILDLRHSGWEWTDGFLFACMIASTDALAVTAIMKDGAGPESLIILAEGESLFNDATSIVFFDLFWPRFKDSIKGTLKHEPIVKVVGNMALDVLRLASGGALVGIGSGIVTRLLFKWLQNRRGHTPVSEVGITVGVAYLCYYIAESVCAFSGVIAVVVYGLYGAATTQWDISPSARESKVFSSFWDVTQLLTNGIVFFYAGASATNFFWRCEEDLFEGNNTDAWLTIFAWLPAVYIGIFALRFLEILVVAPIVGYFGFKLKINEIVFISLAGLRGALALILAQELLQFEFDDDGTKDFTTARKVRAQSALWVCGFVLLTLIINAPGIPYLLQFCGLQNVSSLQKKYQKKSEEALTELTVSAIKEMKEDPNAVYRGVNWKSVEDFVHGSLNDAVKEEAALRRRRTAPNDGVEAIVDQRWQLLESLSSAPNVPTTTGATNTERRRSSMSITDQYSATPSDEAPFSGSHNPQSALLGLEEQGKRTDPLIQPPAKKTPKESVGRETRTNSIVIVYVEKKDVKFLEQFAQLPSRFKIFVESAQFPTQESTHKFFTSQRSYFNLARRNTDLPASWKEVESIDDPPKAESSTRIAVRTMVTMNKAVSMKNPSISVSLLDADMSGQDEDDNDVHRTAILTETQIRMLMGLKKYFQQRRTDGFLSAQGLRFLQWACDKNLEEAEKPLHVWELISEDIKSRFFIRLALRVRHFLRKAEVYLRKWPNVIEGALTPLLQAIAKALTASVAGDLQLALEVAIEYWIGINAYRTHASWLVTADIAQEMAAQIRDQAQKVWIFILDREIESPERFEAIQTFRAKRAIITSQFAFVDELFDVGLLEELEHEHLRHNLEMKRAYLSQRGPVLHNFEIMEFLKNIPFFANVSTDVFRRIISQCQLRQYKHDELISTEPTNRMEAFSFHIIVNGILRSSYTNKYSIIRFLAKRRLDEYVYSLDVKHEFHLGRGGIFGLLSALSGEHYSFIGNGHAELNAMGNGPSVLTVPRSALMNIHTMATKGETQYQQLELDLFRLAALYTVEIMKNDLLSALTAVFTDKMCQLQGQSSVKDTKEFSREGSFVRQLDGGPLSPVTAADLNDFANAPDIVKESYAKAVEVLTAIKEGLLPGELVLVPSGAKYLQTSSSVLVVGKLVPQKSDTSSLIAPIVLPYINNDSMNPQPVEYTAGAQGAIVMSCIDEEIERRNVEDGGMRCGENMACMPHTAAHMHNEFFT